MRILTNNIVQCLFFLPQAILIDLCSALFEPAIHVNRWMAYFVPKSLQCGDSNSDLLVHTRMRDWFTVAISAAHKRSTHLSSYSIQMISGIQQKLVGSARLVRCKVRIKEEHRRRERECVCEREREGQRVQVRVRVREKGRSNKNSWSGPKKFGQLTKVRNFSFLDKKEKILEKKSFGILPKNSIFFSLAGFSAWQDRTSPEMVKNSEVMIFLVKD